MSKAEKARIAVIILMTANAYQFPDDDEPSPINVLRLYLNNYHPHDFLDIDAWVDAAIQPLVKEKYLTIENPQDERCLWRVIKSY